MCLAGRVGRVASVDHRETPQQFDKMATADPGFVRKAKRNYGMRNYGRNYA